MDGYLIKSGRRYNKKSEKEKCTFNLRKICIKNRNARNSLNDFDFIKDSKK
jgi:hypothetical protein